MKCCLCGNENLFEVLFQVQQDGMMKKGLIQFNFEIIQCKICGLILSNYLSEYNVYDFYKNAFLDFPAEEALINDLKPLAKKDNPALLEIGSSNGDLIKKASELGFKVIGVEPNPLCAKKSQEAVPTAKIYCDFFENVNIPNQSIDIIVSYFTLEHIAKPNEFLEKCHHILKPSGVAIFEFPCIQCFAKAKSVSLTNLFYYQHLVHYSKRTGSLMLEKNGFEIISQTFNNTRYDFGQRILCKPANHKPKLFFSESEIEEDKKETMDYLLKWKSEKDAICSKFALLLEQHRQNPVFLFGAGEFCKQLLESLAIEKISNISGIFDNDLDRQGKELLGIPILSPNKIKKEMAIIITVGTKCYISEIQKQLKEIAPEAKKHYL